MKTEFISVRQYAYKEKCSVQNVYQRIKSGSLIGKKIGNYQLVQYEYNN